MAETLGKYELIAHLATGGMAEIWLARQRGMGGFEKLVVIKKILPHLAANREFLQMFADEGRLAAQLSHPNIVQIFDIGRVGTSYFLAMEFVHGENLRFIARRVREKGHASPPLPYVAKIVSQACEALHYAHTKTGVDGRPLGIVHRDISPSNLLLTYQGQVKVVDFGIAKAVDRYQETRAGVVKGNYGYMSPEQCSRREVDHRSDLFALGVVLWELTTGRRLYDHQSDLAMVRAICDQPPPAPSSVRPGVPKQLEKIILKALQKDPDARFQSGHEFHLALERFLHAQGSPVTSVHLARYMKALFPDRLRAWEKVLRQDPSQVSQGHLEQELSTLFHFGTPSDLLDRTAADSDPFADDGFEATKQMPVPPELLAMMQRGSDGSAPPSEDPTMIATSPGMAVVPVIEVEVLLGERVLRTVRLQGTSATVGSGPNADLRTAGDPSVAEEHAVLHVQDGALCITATGGPLKVKGERADFAVLKPEDVVQAGRLAFRARLEFQTATGGAEPQAPKADRSAAKGAEPAQGLTETASADANSAVTDPGVETGALDEWFREDAAAPAAASTAEQASGPEDGGRAAAGAEEPSAASVTTEPAAHGAPPPPPGPSVSLEAPPDGFEPDLYGDEEEDEDDDEAASYVPPFPADWVVEGSGDEAVAPPQEEADSRPVCEVVYERDGVVLDSAVLRLAGRFRPRTRPTVATVLGSRCTVHVPEGGHGQLYQGAATQAISGPAKLSLGDGEKVVFTDEEGFDYHVRVYHPPLMPRSAKHPFRAKLWGISLGLAVAAHLFFALALVFSASVLHVTLPVADPQLAETFAEVKELKDPDKPKPKKKRQRRPKPKRPKPKKVDPTEA
ncbi:MAG: serine/threonine protein kinase, partial [Deltaproteobacteria bacterium]